MPNFRQDPISGHWVIIAPERGRRPSDFSREERKARPDELCPFCPGHESETPLENLAYRESGQANEPGWNVRVFPNKYPAVTGDNGSHDVIVETPDHHVSFADSPIEQTAAFLRATRERILTLGRDGRWQSVVLFKNHGPAAGATREHPHMQLMALPFVPTRLERELAAAEREFDSGGGCYWCRRQSDRVVVNNDGFAAFAPEASRFPFETCILPRTHASHFESAGDDELEQLAAILRMVTRQMNAVLGPRPFNATLMTAPLASAPRQDYHWRVEFIPRLGIMAGFEFATGCYLNSVPPEEAARRLREADPGS